jgi:hypothetical protein
MESKVKEILPGNSTRFGALKSLGISLKIARCDPRAVPGIPTSAYASSKECHSHLIEVECQRSRAMTEVQKFRYNR